MFLNALLISFLGFQADLLSLDLISAFPEALRALGRLLLKDLLGGGPKFGANAANVFLHLMLFLAGPTQYHTAAIIGLMGLVAITTPLVGVVVADYHSLTHKIICQRFISPF